MSVSGASLGTSVVLVLLAFVAWTGYRVALVGGTCLLLAGGGLVLQEAVGWMPTDQAELLTYQCGVVAVTAVVAVPFGLRGPLDGYSGVVVAVVFAMVSFVTLLVVEVIPFLRIVLGALTAVLVLIAVHIGGQLWVLMSVRTAANGTYPPIRRMWRVSMLTALAGILAFAVGGMMPQLWSAVCLLFVGCAACATALQLGVFTVVLVRHGPFARAWAKRWSRTRRETTVELVVWVVADVGALTLLGVPLVVRTSAPVTAALLVAGAACVVASGATLRRVLDRAAFHRYHLRTPANRQVASALRGLAESEPVYRLLPGIARRS